MSTDSRDFLAAPAPPADRRDPPADPREQRLAARSGRRRRKSSALRAADRPVPSGSVLVVNGPAQAGQYAPEILGALSGGRFVPIPGAPKPFAYELAF